MVELLHESILPLVENHLYMLKFNLLKVRRPC
jgi:hypothetical protein